MRKYLFFLASLLFFGCGTDDEPVVDDSPKLSILQSEIFDLNCAVSGCHIGSTPPKGLNLENGNTFSNIVNVPSDEQPDLKLIEPGNPEESYLYQKITGATGIIGSQMPLGRSPLSIEEMEQIRDWILEGALDN